VEVGIAGKIDRLFLDRFRPSLTEVSHVTWRGALLEMMDGTKGGAQSARSLRPRCVGKVDPETPTHILTNNVIFHISIKTFICFKHTMDGCLKPIQKFPNMNFVIILSWVHTCNVTAYRNAVTLCHTIRSYDLNFHPLPHAVMVSREHYTNLLREPEA
jgi:hypothetical protein